MMRKYPIKEISKRQWKTPSPSPHNDIKSPRANMQLRPQTLKAQNSKTNNIHQKMRVSFSSFKNQLVGQKNDASKQAQQKSQETTITPLQLYSDVVHKTVGDETESYNSYFTKASSVYNNIVKEQAKSSKNISRSKQIRETGFKSELEVETGLKSHSVIEIDDRLCKYVEQTAKLKHNYKNLELDYRKLEQYCKNIENELEMNLSLVKSLRKSIEDKSEVESTLNLEITRLKDKIAGYSFDLHQSDLHIYQLKQELAQSTSKAPFPQPPSVSPAVSPFKIGKELSPTPPQQCQKCRTSKKLICAMSMSIENKILDAHKKQTLIQTLYNDLQKMETQSKMFQKPKMYVKKIAMLLEINNDDIVRNKLKEINLKYLKTCN